MAAVLWSVYNSLEHAILQGQCARIQWLPISQQRRTTPKLSRDSFICSKPNFWKPWNKEVTFWFGSLNSLDISATMACTLGRFILLRHEYPLWFQPLWSLTFVTSFRELDLPQKVFTFLIRVVWKLEQPNESSCRGRCFHGRGQQQHLDCENAQTLPTHHSMILLTWSPDVVVTLTLAQRPCCASLGNVVWTNEQRLDPRLRNTVFHLAGDISISKAPEILLSRFLPVRESLTTGRGSWPSSSRRSRSSGWALRSTWRIWRRRGTWGTRRARSRGAARRAGFRTGSRCAPPPVPEQPVRSRWSRLSPRSTACPP